MLLDQIELFYVFVLILIHDLMLALNLLCPTKNFLCCTLQISLVDLLIFILPGKNGKFLCDKYVLDILCLLQKYILCHYFHHIFLLIHH